MQTDLGWKFSSALWLLWPVTLYCSPSFPQQGKLGHPRLIPSWHWGVNNADWYSWSLTNISNADHVAILLCYFCRERLWDNACLQVVLGVVVYNDFTRAAQCAAFLDLCVSSSTSSTPVSWSGIVTCSVTSHLASIASPAAAAPSSPWAPAPVNCRRNNSTVFYCSVVIYIQSVCIWETSFIFDIKWNLTRAWFTVAKVNLDIISFTLSSSVLGGRACTEACPLSGSTSTGNTTGSPIHPGWPFSIHCKPVPVTL